MSLAKEVPATRDVTVSLQPRTGASYVQAFVIITATAIDFSSIFVTGMDATVEVTTAWTTFPPVSRRLPGPFS